MSICSKNSLHFNTLLNLALRSELLKWWLRHVSIIHMMLCNIFICDPPSDIPDALFGHRVAVGKQRPVFTPDAPPEYADLAERCWRANAEER